MDSVEQSRRWPVRWAFVAVLALPAASVAGSIAVGAIAAQPRPERSELPFAVVDKRSATLRVFAANGRLVGSTPVLIGLAPGDALPSGSRRKSPDRLLPSERVTPAGHFPSLPGTNMHGERVIWIDYEAGLAIHRLRPAPPQERRAERLASPTPADNRITMGCVVVDPRFFDSVVLPTLGHGPAWVHVLREGYRAESDL